MDKGCGCNPRNQWKLDMWQKRTWYPTVKGGGGGGGGGGGEKTDLEKGLLERVCLTYL